MIRSPFIIIRRFLILAFYAGVASGGLWLYFHPQVFNPFVDLYHVWKSSKDVERGYVVEFEVRTTQILDDRTLKVKDAKGEKYHFRLTGVGPAAGEQALERKALMAEMLQDQQIRFLATFTNQNHVAMGVAFRDGTNVNLTLVRNGVAKLDRDSIKSLPLLDQYRMVRAARKVE